MRTTRTAPYDWGQTFPVGGFEALAADRRGRAGAHRRRDKFNLACSAWPLLASAARRHQCLVIDRTGQARRHRHAHRGRRGHRRPVVVAEDRPPEGGLGARPGRPDRHRPHPTWPSPTWPSARCPAPAPPAVSSVPPASEPLATSPRPPAACSRASTTDWSPARLPGGPGPPTRQLVRFREPTRGAWLHCGAESVAGCAMYASPSKASVRSADATPRGLLNTNLSFQGLFPA